MEQFDTLREAQSFVGLVVDQPQGTSVAIIKPGIRLTKSSIDMGMGRFTNSFDLAFDAVDQQAEVIAFDTLTSTYDFMATSEPGQYTAATGGGFFYLADRASSSPRQLALNLSIAGGNVRSLPVADRETVIAGPGIVEVRPLVALGALTLNGYELAWSGSLTDHDTEVKAYSNGNVVINHLDDTITGSQRVLDERSRYTPLISGEGSIDVGFIGRGRNTFASAAQSATGNVDIFAHDFVLRCPQKYIGALSEVEIHTIGGLAVSEFKGGAFSAGPELDCLDFDNHDINRDLSLGDHPPFRDVRLARSVLYKTMDNLTHIRLFDGRRGSPTFTGITPTETVDHIKSEGEIEWGCFLDPGQTAKLCVNYPDRTASYGNRHYMKWPSQADVRFGWIPEAGRAVANVIAL